MSTDRPDRHPCPDCGERVLTEPNPYGPGFVLASHARPDRAADEHGTHACGGSRLAVAPERQPEPDADDERPAALRRIHRPDVADCPDCGHPVYTLRGQLAEHSAGPLTGPRCPGSFTPAGG